MTDETAKPKLTNAMLGAAFKVWATRHHPNWNNDIELITALYWAIRKAESDGSNT